MKNFRSEGPISYEHYQFGYGDWLQLEVSDDPKVAYTTGHLPYSGDTKDPRHLFYMARSLRVDLTTFSMDKKRRYDHRQWAAFNTKRTLLRKTRFLDAYGEEAMDLAKKWMTPRFGEKALPMNRLAYILDKPYLNQVLTWTREDKLIAYALLVSGDWGSHYWYVFYENGAGTASAPGHGYLADFLEWANAEDLPHAYIGTAYGLKSRYKSRGLKGVEFWDGNQWNPDKEDLKRRQDLDDLRR